MTTPSTVPRVVAEVQRASEDSVLSDPTPVGAPLQEEIPEPTYSVEEVAALRVEFEAFVRARNVSPEVLAFVCPWIRP